MGRSEPSPRVGASALAHWRALGAGVFVGVVLVPFEVGADENAASLVVPESRQGAAPSGADQEANHARLCLTVLGRLTGQSWCFEPFPEARTVATEVPNFGELALESLREGCFGEQLSQAMLHAAADAAVEPWIAGALATMAREESRHATLAWDVLDFCLQRDPRLHRDLAVEARRSSPALAGGSESPALGFGEFEPEHVHTLHESTRIAVIARLQVTRRLPQLRQ